MELAGVAKALLPARSLAVPAARVMPRVPSPVMLEMVTVRVVDPLPLMVTVPLAVPVLLTVILAVVRETLAALL